MNDDRSRWEERYSARSAQGMEPSAFVVAHAASIHGRALDLAAGAGRNTLFLARRGVLVEAIDIAFAGLQQLRAIATAEALPISLIQADLEAFPLPVERYDAILNIRYLQRSLFTPIQRALKPGGIVVFETFLIDQLQIGHPRNPAFLLQRGELRAAFAGFEILEYYEGGVGAEPQAFLAQMVARRPAIA